MDCGHPHFHDSSLLNTSALARDERGLYDSKYLSSITRLSSRLQGTIGSVFGWREPFRIGFHLCGQGVQKGFKLTLFIPAKR